MTKLKEYKMFIDGSWVESENKYVSLTVSAKGMRIIDKKGIDEVLKDIRSRGEKI